MAKDTCKCINVIPNTQECTDALVSGRLDIAQIVCPKGLNFMSFTIYGWTGGHDDRAVAKRTGCLLNIVSLEATTWPNNSILRSGGINGDVIDFPCLQRQIAKGNWIDIGAVAYQWGQPAAARPTCFAPGSREGSRPDYMFATTGCCPTLLTAGCARRATSRSTLFYSSDCGDLMPYRTARS